MGVNWLIVGFFIPQPSAALLARGTVVDVLARMHQLRSRQFAGRKIRWLIKYLFIQ